MPTFRTHYDNLKVSRDAPIEVIQAAYRSLARKHHPDRAGGTPEAEKVMKIINASYEVLSDPVRRAEHDRWIDDRLAENRRFPADSDIETRAWENDPAGDRSTRPRHPGRSLQSSVAAALFAICYFTAALAMLRSPGLRFVGIGMLIAGWFYFQSRRR